MPDHFRRVAALYDIHGNLPALDAVLPEVRAANVDLVVIGGDIVPGPMPREALERLLALDMPVRFIHGNCELAILAQLEVAHADAASYWGSSSGRPLSPAYRAGMRWSAFQVAEHAREIAHWPRTLRLAIDELGDVLFCHATPRSETEIFTGRTSDAKLRPLFEHLGVPVVVCGHTHMAFDRMVGATRVVNPGSLGAPIGEPGAYWALLGPGVELQRTCYDFTAAARRIRAIDYPQADEDARAIEHPNAEAAMLDLYSTAELK